MPYAKTIPTLSISVPSMFSAVLGALFLLASAAIGLGEQVLVVQPVIAVFSDTTDETVKKAEALFSDDSAADRAFDDRETDVQFLPPRRWTVPESVASRSAAALLAVADPQLEPWSFDRAVTVVVGPPVSTGDANQNTLVVRENWMALEAPGTPDELAKLLHDSLAGSPTIRPHVYCLPPDEAKRVILDERLEPFFARMQRREIGALTGEAATAESLEECREVARQRFASKTYGFTEREAAALERAVAALEKQLGTKYPLLTKHPWRFVKLDDSLCGGFPHTRSDCIVFYPRVMDGFLALWGSDEEVDGQDRLVSLLLHEQFHVLERLYPERFAALARDVFELHQAQVEDHAWLAERQLQNPDAPHWEWLIREVSPDGGEQWWWPRTILRGDAAVPRMGADFRAIAVLVRRGDAGWSVVEDGAGVPVSRRLTELAPHFAGGLFGGAIDHPNELAAYASALLLQEKQPADNSAVDSDAPVGHDTQLAFLQWCRDHLQ